MRIKMYIYVIAVSPYRVPKLKAISSSSGYRSSTPLFEMLIRIFWNLGTLLHVRHALIGTRHCDLTVTSCACRSAVDGDELNVKTDPSYQKCDSKPGELSESSFSTKPFALPRPTLVNVVTLNAVISRRRWTRATLFVSWNLINCFVTLPEKY